MVIKTMSVQECREMLARVGFGRLGCSRNDQPYIVPVYFAYEADHLYGFSLVGRKIEWMRSNPRVCVEADEITGQFEWASVIATGRYRELADTAEPGSERSRAEELLKERYMWWETACEIHQEHRAGPVGPFLFYSVHIEEISGLRAVPGPVESMAPL
jgi:uncharacterized protein